jgi:NAD(P)-dependent dehydrogenase (short-subunit alcohol dehydrogenase family)
MRLQGKVALVTGGASGIGRAASLLMAGEGAQVAIADLDLAGAEAAAAVIEARGHHALAIGADVSDPEQVRSMVERVVNQFGRIDVLVNNAGILIKASALEMTEDVWRRSMGVLLDGAFFVAQAVGRHMVEQGIQGSIVNTGSISGLVAMEGSTAYCVAKAGVQMLSRVLALEWAPYGIRVNCVLPGYVDTPMVAYADANLRKAWEREVPMGRFGQPEEIAKMMVVLASEDASFVTGAALPIDGGRLVH